MRTVVSFAYVEGGNRIFTFGLFGPTRALYVNYAQCGLGNMLCVFGARECYSGPYCSWILDLAMCVAYRYFTSKSILSSFVFILELERTREGTIL